MICIGPDWNRRKQAIGTAFRKAPFLPADHDPEEYAAIMKYLPLHDQRDIAILVAIVRDAIMQARRDERPTTPLEGFLQWLVKYQSGTI